MRRGRDGTLQVGLCPKRGGQEKPGNTDTPKKIQCQVRNPPQACDVGKAGCRPNRAQKWCAWLLGLVNPETTPLATLRDSILGRGMTLEGDELIALDRLLPPAPETPVHWLLRRAATEVLYDEGLGFIMLGSTIVPEPVPGQRLDPAAGISLVEGMVRDVLGVGGINPLLPQLPGLVARGRAGLSLIEGTTRAELGVGRVDALLARLRAVAARGRVGSILTRIEVAPDLGSATAESSVYYFNGSDWNRAIWRSQTLPVGAVPPVVVTIVERDPQVKALMNLIDSVGAGFVSPEMKERGLAVGTTVGGAVVLARTALIRSLAGLAFDIDDKGPLGVPRESGHDN